MEAINALSPFVAVAAGIGSLYAVAYVRPAIRKHGGLLFFRVGRFGGSFYIAKKRDPRLAAFGKTQFSDAQLLRGLDIHV